MKNEKEKKWSWRDARLSYIEDLDEHKELTQ
jgi:hypothetical protein